MGKKEASENVQVVVRCRPMNKREKEAEQAGKCKDVITTCIAENCVRVKASECEQEKCFTFDKIYNKQFSQHDIYLQTIHPLVESVLNGYNATVFAYGQSGTGKTHTMTGVLGTPDQGIIPNALEHVFKFVNTEIESGSKKEYSIHVSYLELYNGKCRDLLTDTKKNLELKENEHKLFYVKDLEKVKVIDTSQCMRLMTEGATRREVGSTLLNQDSSRSHSVFTLEVTCLNVDEEPPTAVVSKLNLVDLAGSERQTKTAAEGDRLKEGSNINLSLSALGTVIDVLVKGKGHIPFRSSPLTMLLKDSLGGNSRTVMFATISPSELNCAETLSTLRFADRAKKIKNKPRVQMDPKDALIQQLRDELYTLKRKYGAPDTADDDATRLEELQVEVTTLKDEICALQSEVERLTRGMKTAQDEAAAEKAAAAQLSDEVKLGKETNEDTTSQLLSVSRIVHKFLSNALSGNVFKEWQNQLKGIEVAQDPVPAAALENGLGRALKQIQNSGAAQEPRAGRCDSPNGDYKPHTPPQGVSSPVSSEDESPKTRRRSSSKRRKKKKSSNLQALDMSVLQNLPETLTPQQEEGVRELMAHIQSGEKKKLKKNAAADQQREELINKFMAVEEKLEAALIEKDATLEELTKNRLVFEKVKRQAALKTQVADELQREVTRLKGLVKESESAGRRAVEDAQSKLIAENNRRHEQVMDLHQQELLKVKKQATDAKKKIKKAKDAYGELEGKYDQKVVEFNELMTDFEALKVRSMKTLRDGDVREDQRLWPINQNTIKLTSIASTIMKTLNSGLPVGGQEESGAPVRPAKSAPLISTYGVKSPEAPSADNPRRPMSGIEAPPAPLASSAPFAKPPLPGLEPSASEPSPEKITPIPPPMQRSGLGIPITTRKYID